MDDVVLDIESNIPEHPWHKSIRLKKYIWPLWEQGKQSGVDALNNYANIAGDIAKSGFEGYASSLVEYRQQPDGPPIAYTLDGARIAQAGAMVKNHVNDAVATFAQQVWPDCPLSALNDKKVKESWGWHWTPSLELTLGGGGISVLPNLGVDAWEWIQSVNDYGFNADDLFEFKRLEAALDITSDGNNATGDYHLKLRFEGKMWDDQNTGHMEYFLGGTLYLRLP